MSRGILVFVDTLIFLFYKTQYEYILGINIHMYKIMHMSYQALEPKHSYWPEAGGMSQKWQLTPG